MHTNLENILRLPQVIKMVGLGRSTIYAEMKAGRFPKQIKLTNGRCVGWLSSDLASFIQACKEKSDEISGGSN